MTQRSFLRLRSVLAVRRVERCSTSEPDILVLGGMNGRCRKVLHRIEELRTAESDDR